VISEAPPTLLISYSWDSDQHKDWVRNLVERLRLNGVDVRLDQWHVSPGQSLTQFMETEIVRCDHVLIVCTPNYYKKSLNRQGGVGYEQQIISGHIAAGIAREKFIPLVREGTFDPGNTCSIPPHFAGIYALDIREDSQFEHVHELLLRTIFKSPVHEVPLIGKRPDWSKSLRVEEEFEEVRLATIDLDGWELESGLAQHHRTPETFYMPSEKERRALMEGDIVKLIFQIAVSNLEDSTVVPEFSNERMWVIVTGRVGPYYIGTLNNNPGCSDEQSHLAYEDEVAFLPEHVIDIYED
jgi:hypothetical protein